MRIFADIYQIFDTIKPDACGCHNWPRRNGLIGLRCAVEVDGKIRPVHRLALERKLGRPITPGLHVLHNCDWPSCVNPEHLREGTHNDNMHDRVLRPTKPWHVLLAMHKGIEPRPPHPRPAFDDDDLEPYEPPPDLEPYEPPPLMNGNKTFEPVDKLSPRARNVLINDNCEPTPEAVATYYDSVKYLLRAQNCGRKTAAEIQGWLVAHGQNPLPERTN